MTSSEMIHVEKDAIGDSAAHGSESLIQPMDGIGQAVGEICFSDVAERGVVRDDATLKEDSSGAAGTKVSEQLLHSSDGFSDFCFDCIADAICTQLRQAARNVLEIEDDDDEIRLGFCESALRIEQLIDVRTVAANGEVEHVV